MSTIPPVAEMTSQATRKMLLAEPVRAAPKGWSGTGLDQSLLMDLTGKYLLSRGRTPILEIAEALKLPAVVIDEVLQIMRQDTLIEINRQGITDAGIECRLTDNGRIRAHEALQRNRYIGPAPIPLDQFASQVHAQAAAQPSVNDVILAQAFHDLVIPKDLADRLGAAINSRRAVLMYGPAGSGKTFLAERLARLLPGTVAIPFAIAVGGEIIQMFDPLVHRPLLAPENSGAQVRTVLPRTDRRWITCHRPVVLTGGELTLDMLDLRFDASTGFYQAPPHVKAMGGLFIVDDLGRQLVAPRDLMNRWIVPLERGVDYLTTHSGLKFEIPFELKVVFSTNYPPSKLADDAFLRRFGHKIHIGSISPRDYKRIFEQACLEQGVAFSNSAFEWLLVTKHARERRPLLAAYPKDLVGRICDIASYRRQAAQMTNEMLEQAWQTYFLADTDPDVEANTFGTA